MDVIQIRTMFNSIKFNFDHVKSKADELIKYPKQWAWFEGFLSIQTCRFEMLKNLYNTANLANRVLSGVTVSARKIIFRKIFPNP